MKRFNNLRPLGGNEWLTFVGTPSRYRVQGVANCAVSVYAQTETMDDPVFAFYLAPGEFSFDVGHVESFALRFDVPEDGKVSLYETPAAHLIVHNPDDSWTTINPRPAIDPNLAAVQRQLRQLQLHVQQTEAMRRARARPKPEPSPSPVPPQAEPENFEADPAQPPVENAE